MCIRVQYAAHDSIRPWDARRQVITIPQELTDPYILDAVRATLTKLGVEQDEFGARCWCGESIQLLPRVPEQRRSGQVMTHGA